MLGNDSTLDIPAIDPKIAAPLLNDEIQTVVDMGANPQGLHALARYRHLLETEGFDQIVVINRNRPETSDFESVASMIEMMEATSQTKMTHIVNTTHMLKSTRLEEVSEKLNIPVLYNACIKEIAQEVKDDPRNKYDVFPMDLHFRNHWMI